MRMEARIDIVTNAKLAAGGWPLSATNILNRVLDMNNYIKNKIKQ